MSAVATGHMDNAWIRVDESADPGFFIRFLDASRARMLEFARRSPQTFFAHLELRPGLSLLDCGCGTGDVLALMATLTAPGEAVGGDFSEAMLTEARKRHHAPGLRFEPMDVQKLAFPDRSFDRTFATQLLIHVEDPRKAMSELCRVTRAGGQVVLSDMDWDTLVLGTSDREAGRQFTRHFCDGVRNGTAVRDYAGWLRAEGFVDVRTVPQVLLFESWPFVREWIVDPSIPHFLAKGLMTAAQATALTQELAARDASGRHFAAVTSYTVMARRP